MYAIRSYYVLLATSVLVEFLEGFQLRITEAEFFILLSAELLDYATAIVLVRSYNFV